MTWNFLKKYCELMANTEVPPRFAIWTGLATILATLETRIYINQGIYTIRPNFYIVLVAPSGLKKSTPIIVAKRILERLQPRLNLVSQKITPEALIGQLKKLGESKPEPGKTIVNLDPKSKCGGIIIADELATFLDKNSLDRGLGPMLTTLFDCGPFEYTTNARGVERLENSYLSMLGGTTVELLRNSLPKDAIGGGFTSRTMFIYEDRRPPPVPWVDFDDSLIKIEHDLVAYLQRLMTLTGPITVAPDARALYESIYTQRYRNVSEQPALANYENRRHAHLFKVAMALMVCEEPQLTLTREHLYGANVLLEEAEEFLPRVMDLLVASDKGHAHNMVLAYIQSKGEKGVSRQDLMRRFSNQFNGMELSAVLDTMIAKRGGSGDIEVDTQGGYLHYKAIQR